MPLMPMADIEKARDATKAAVGDVSNFEVFGNNVLVGLYKRPDRTKSGIILADSTRDEDRYQGKVGMVLKKGPLAFKGGDKYDFGGLDVNEGDWVVFRVSDGWPLSINDKDGHCRMVPDFEIRARVSQPDLVF